MRPFSDVYFEICGACNGRCPYCPTGSRRQPSGGMVRPDVFDAALGRLLDGGIVAPGTCVHVYNWGEPFLHPTFHEIVDRVNRLGLRYAVSTNASRIPEVDEGLAANLRSVIFSMPGFSQASYDRIHGFDFPAVRRNIARLAEDLRAHGFAGVLRVHYHVYQFNVGEIEPCARFAADLGAQFRPTYAILGDWRLLKGWVEDTLPRELMKRIAQDLFLHYLPASLAATPPGYRCPQRDLLVLDERAEVSTCCLLPRDHEDYACGAVLGADLDGALRRRTDRAVCRWCIESGIAYHVHHRLAPEFLAAADAAHATLAGARSPVPVA